MEDRYPEPDARPRRHRLLGTISSAGFASGDRFVIGSWEASPIGPFTDVMWAAPSDEKVLLVGSERVGRFVSAVYGFGFSRVEVVAIDGHLERGVLSVEAGDVRLHFEAGPGWRIPLRAIRPPAVTRWVEGPLARLLLGVRTYGVSPSGVREWYVADEYRPVAAARASIGGTDLGDLQRRWTATGFGFSEPPTPPAMVRVRPLLVDPSGGLDRVVA